MRDPYASRGYVYGSDPNMPLERSAEPLDWFHIVLWTVMIVSTVAVMAYAMGWVS